MCVVLKTTLWVDCLVHGVPELAVGYGLITVGLELVVE